MSTTSLTRKTISDHISLTPPPKTNPIFSAHALKKETNECISESAK